MLAASPPDRTSRRSLACRFAHTILLLAGAVVGLPLRYAWKPSSPVLLQRLAMSSKSKAAAAPALISVKAERIRLLSSVKSVKPSPGGVVYWMSRDQRVQDNWALLHARQLADEHGVGLSVAFCMVPGFLGATIRHYGFMLKGLAEVEAELRTLGIPFTLLQGEPGAALPDFVRRHEVAAVVSDFSPLRISRGWKDELVKALTHAHTTMYFTMYSPCAHCVLTVYARPGAARHAALRGGRAQCGACVDRLRQEGGG